MVCISSRNILLLSIFLLLTLNLNIDVDASNFGVKGHTHQIEEQAFLEMIEERLSKVDLAAKQEEMKNIAKERSEEPRAVDNITPAKDDRSFYFDPTYVTAKDIYLPNGDLYYKKGTRVNPLQEMEKRGMDFSRRMIFIDAREEEQILWLKDKLEVFDANKSKKLENRVILVGGRPFELMEELGIDVYFDQGGVITKKLGIKASPAIAEQDKYNLKIEEYAIKNIR